jgi:DNA-binding response OmpR family regulator
LRKKVLIVEDEPILGMMYRKGLEPEYDVAAVLSTGEEAIAETERERPDFIVMDIVLAGDMDGIEAAGKIKKLFGIPFIFITGNNDEGTRIRALQTDPLNYLVKPINIKQLCGILESAFN